jgi:hypothetical protein
VSPPLFVFRYYVTHFFSSEISNKAGVEPRCRRDKARNLFAIDSTKLLFAQYVFLIALSKNRFVSSTETLIKKL